MDWRARADCFKVWIEQNVPPGVRTLLGLLLILGGVLGFLPVLGFWMIPLGVFVIALDVGSLRRMIRRRRKAQKPSTDEDGSADDQPQRRP